MITNWRNYNNEHFHWMIGRYYPKMIHKNRDATRA